jgi:hypothetical protein
MTTLTPHNSIIIHDRHTAGFMIESQLPHGMMTVFVGNVWEWRKKRGHPPEHDKLKM